MAYEHIRYEVENGRAPITLDRPGRRNALCPPLFDELERALWVWLLERSNRRIRALWEMHKPSIAQLHGHCLAGGTDLALACDMLIAAEDASIGFPPARNLGALPNNLGVYHCGPQWAKRLQLTGDTVSGAAAAKIAFHERDAKFGDGRARVEGPELRDERGFLRDAKP
jgi:enoyl-CoA hydratase